MGAYGSGRASKGFRSARQAEYGAILGERGPSREILADASPRARTEPAALCKWCGAGTSLPSGLCAKCEAIKA